MNRIFMQAASLLALGIGSTSAFAQHQAADNATAIESILVTGRKAGVDLIPGSAIALTAADLAIFDHSDINRTLRQVPGINIQEEEGYGLFPNIGVRGTSVERSENVTLMEDGVLIAPAPYAAPAAYYFPSAGRMSAIEVVKGATAVRYGPRTIGGAINLRSTPIASAPFAGLASARYGTDDFYEVHGWVSGESGPVAALVETFQSGSDGFKRLDTGGNTGFELEDYLAKIRLSTADDAAVRQSLEFKIGRTDIDAEETYLGLSDGDFASTPYRRYAGSQEDRFASKHRQYMLTHRLDAGDVRITTVAYLNKFSRNWHKLNDINIGTGGFLNPQGFFDDPSSAASLLGLAILSGETDSAPGALRVRNNNRAYESKGIQSALSLPFVTGTADHVLEMSLRWHEDEEDRLQHDELFQMQGGRMVLTSVRPQGSNANRVARADALAFFIQDTISLGGLTLTPGLRYEAIDLAQLNYGTNDPGRENGTTSRVRSSLDAVLPALGATYAVSDAVTLLASVSRGFSPPAPGSADAREEKSWNYEAGLRYRRDAWQAALIGFFNDYSNILGSCTNAVGCTTGDIGDQFNGGKVDVKGIEASLAGRFALSPDLSVPVSLTYTFTDAQFRQQFTSAFFGSVRIGDRLPYIPRHQGQASIGLDARNWSLTLAANHVGAVRTDAGSGPIPALEKVPARTIFDLAGRVRVSDRISLFGRVDNLFDKTYAVARRPMGLRPGKPQSFIGGVDITF